MLSWREDERLHDLNDLLFFAAVVEHSGFSAAARSLNLPKSSVSRHVGRLEDRLGVRLLERSTRNVRLTEIGSSYYARCKALLSELETAEQDLALLRSDPIGTIRVSCPTGLAQYALARIVPGFLADYPLVRVQIIATNRAVDLIEEKVDVAIRARTRMNDETLTMRRLGSSTLVFVASPDFVDRHPVLVHPSDITGLPFLSFQEDTARPSWTLTGPDEAATVVAFDPILWTSEFSILVEAACLERGFLSYRLKLPCDRSEKDAWFGYSPVGALRKLPCILYSRPAEDWLQRSGSSSTISPTTLFFAISARGRHNYSRSSPRRGARE